MNVVAVQQTSSDLRMNPHVHAVFLDGAYEVDGDRVVFHPLPKLTTRDVAEVLEQALKCMSRYRQHRGPLENAENGEEETIARDLDSLRRQGRQLNRRFVPGSSCSFAVVRSVANARTTCSRPSLNDPGISIKYP